jgi:hypothetical protein
LLLRFQSSSIPQATLNQIKKGMTVAEVEAILGRPTSKVSGTLTLPGVEIVGTISEWKRGGTVAIVGFNDAGVVTDTIFGQRSFVDALGDLFQDLTGWN